MDTIMINYSSYHTPTSHFLSFSSFVHQWVCDPDSVMPMSMPIMLMAMAMEAVDVLLRISSPPSVSCLFFLLVPSSSSRLSSLNTLLIPVIVEFDLIAWFHSNISSNMWRSLACFHGFVICPVGYFLLVDLYVMAF